MKLFVLYLCLVGTSCAIPLRRRRKAGFGSKSEEMLPFGAYGFLNSPQLSQLAASLYGYRPSYLQLFPQQPMPPLSRPSLWQQQMPAHEATRFPSQNPHRLPQQPSAARRPNSRPQPKPQLPPQQPRHQVQQPQIKVQQPPKLPPSAADPSQPQPQLPDLQSKAFLPHQQQPWHFPQMFGHGGFQPQMFGPYQGRTPLGRPLGRPHVSNEEGAPYFGYGYHGMGHRPPYSEEMFEQDFEEPVEKEPAKETPATNPVTNSTVTDTNTTVSNPASQGGNATISEPIATGNGANPLGLQSKLVDGNGFSTPSPTAHVSGGNGAAQDALEQSGHQPKSPNMIQSFPPASQQSTGHVPHIYNPHSEMGDARHNTLTFRGNPSIQAENPSRSFGYRDNLDPRGNLQSTNSNQAMANPRPISYGPQEQSHLPGRSPSGQREIMPIPTSDPPSRWNKDPVYRDNYLHNSPPEGHSVDPQINTFRQPSGMQQPNILSEQEIFPSTKRTPFETETHWYDWKQQLPNPPDRERERFPSAQNQMWSSRENSQIFQDAPPRYNSMYSLDSIHQRGQEIYSERNSFRNPYQQNGHPSTSRTWEERKESPVTGSTGQRERLSYSPILPSNQMQKNHYHRSVQQEHEAHPNQNPWVDEKHLLDVDREYKNPSYNPPQYPMHPRFSTETPPNERDNLPYERMNQWTPEKHIFIPVTEHLKPVENIPYHTNGMFGQKDQNMGNQGSNSPPQSISLSQRGAQYAERSTWVPPILGPSPQKETSPYFNAYSTDLRRKSDDDIDDTGKITHGSAPLSSVNVAGRRHYPDTRRYSEDYRGEHRTITTHSTADHLCCAEDSPVTKEGLPAPLRSAPQFRLAPWEEKISTAYSEGSHGKHARHAPSPAGIQSNYPFMVGKKQKENLDTFTEEAAGAQKNLPCSKSKLSQDHTHETNCETGLPPSENTHDYGNSLRGDRHSIPAAIMGESESRREFRQAAVKLVPEKSPEPQRIRSQALASEDGRKGQHAALEIKRIPCFASWLKQYLSSTGAPSGDQQHNLFHGETPVPTSRPNDMPPESKPISSTNPSHDDREGKHLKFGSPGEEWVERPNETTPDCLLLQKK
ncbi:enamelin [Pogona vitticeps]